MGNIRFKKDDILHQAVDFLRVGGWKEVSLVDVIGASSFTLWLSGCNLRCPWCGNASLADGTSGRLVPLDDLTERILDAAPFVDYLHVTGGEPTLQYKPLEKLFEKVRGHLKLSISTNGTSPHALARLIGYLSHVAIDIKAPLDSPELFARSTGLGSVEVAAGFLEALKASLSLASSAPFLELRITLVPGILDDADTIRRTVLGVGDVVREGGRRVLVFQQFVPYPTVRDQKFRSVPRTDPGFAKKLAELASRLVDYEVYVRTLEEGVTPIRVQGPACPP